MEWLLIVLGRGQIFQVSCAQAQDGALPTGQAVERRPVRSLASPECDAAQLGQERAGRVRSSCTARPRDSGRRCKLLDLLLHLCDTVTEKSPPLFFKANTNLRRSVSITWLYGDFMSRRDERCCVG